MKNKYNKIISIVLMLTMIIGYLPNYSISFAETLDESSLEIEMEDGVISYKTWEAKAIAEEGIRYSIEGLSIHTKLSPSGSPNVEGKVGLSKVGDDRDLENGFLELSWEVSETELRQALTDNGIDIIEKGTKVYVSGIYQTHYRYLDGSMTIRKENLDSFNEIANAEAWSNSTDVFKQWFNIPFTFDPLPMPITVNAIDSSSGNVFSSYELDDYMPENNRNVPVNISDLSSSALPKTFESAKYYTASVDDSSKAEDLKESFSTENIILEDTYINGGVLEVYYKAPEGGSGLDIGVYGTASPRSVQANGSDEVSVTVNVESEIFDIGSLNVESYKLEVEDEEFTFTNGDSNVEHDFKMKIDTSKYQEDDEFTDSISKTWNIKATANLSDGSILSKTTTDKTTVVKGFDPPIVDLYLPSSVKLGDSVDMRASASSPQGSDIDEYYWNFDNVDQPYDGKPSVNDYFFEEEGEHNVEVIAVDSNGMGGSDEGTIEVLPPTVDASITTTGHLKEYRKISVSSLGSDSP